MRLMYTVLIFFELVMLNPSSFHQYRELCEYFSLKRGYNKFEFFL